MAHALAADLRNGHLDAALFADNALVLHALVLAAQAFVILDRTEDARAEQAVALGLERAAVDGLRLLDLAVGPGQNLLRARDRNRDLIEALRLGRLVEEIHDLLIHRRLLRWRSLDKHPHRQLHGAAASSPRPNVKLEALTRQPR